MLTMIQVKKRLNRGHGRAELTVRTRRAAKAPIVKERYLSKKKPVLFVGEAGANKSRTLARLVRNHAHVHGEKPYLRISAFDPLGAWLDDKRFNQWLDQCEHEASTQWAKAELLPQYIAESKAVLYIDDAHKLSGRKMHIARRMLDASHKWYMTASDLGRMPPTLRLIADTDKVQTVRLSTRASYDATKALMLLVLVSMAAVGAWEAAIVLGLFTQLASGRNASRQD